MPTTTRETVEASAKSATPSPLASGASAHGILLVVDPSEPETLREADAWLLRAREELKLGAFQEHTLLLAHKHDIAGVTPAPLGPHELDAY